MADIGGVKLSSTFCLEINRDRKRNLGKWKRNEKKFNRNNGQPYLAHKNKPVPGKILNGEVSAKRLQPSYVTKFL